jgi:hypothetical protein
MAEIIPSGLISEMSGKLGLTVFYRRKNKLIQRAWAKPTKPRTPSQISCGHAWQSLRLSWGSLSEDQRQSWEFAAVQLFFTDSVGNQYHPSGYILYLKCNTNLNYAGLTTIPRFVTPLPVLELYSPSLISPLVISFPNQTTQSNINYLIYATKSLSSGIKNGNKYLRFIGVLPHNTTGSFNILSLYTALFPAPVTGCKIFIKLIPVEINSGLSSLPLFFHSIIS